MYFNQPNNGNVTSIHVPSYPSVPQFQPTLQYPTIIGEGEVTSAVYPDGSIQFLFMPTLQPWLPGAYGQNSALFTPNSGYNNNDIAWYVRSIPNPLPFTHPTQMYSSCPLPNLDQNINGHQGLQLKFHNDGWTSTTDLHYFFPNIIRKELFPKVSTAIQGDLPEIRCLCSKSKTNDQSNCNCGYKCKKKGWDHGSHISNNELYKNKSKLKSSYKQRGKKKLCLSDKSITTYNDQSCSTESKPSCFESKSTLSFNRKMKCKEKRKSPQHLCVCDSACSLTSTDVTYTCNCDSCDSMQE